MPAVETAPTATATQTRAAGSRMLGYYMDGPVRVDCLFDTANFLTKDSDGRVPLGSTTSAAYRIDMMDTSAMALGVFRDFDVSGGAAGTIIDMGARAGATPTVAARLLGVLFDANSGYLSLQTRSGGALAERMVIEAGGAVRPGGDNGQSSGSPSYRWSVLYAVNGTINTSDARDKSWRGAPSEAELRAARRIAAELGFYQWNDAIAAKGADGARMHFGVRAQAVWAIMADEGLIEPLAEGVDPGSAYAFLCWDKWDAVEPVAEVRDEDGRVLVAARPGRPAGSRFGVRVDQLALFLIAAQEARLAALEAAA